MSLGWIGTRDVRPVSTTMPRDHDGRTSLSVNPGSFRSTRRSSRISFSYHRSRSPFRPA